jgi:tight adherence protein B
MEHQSLIAAGLLALAVASLMYAFVYPYLSGDIKAQKRAAALVSSSRTRANAAARSSDPAKRRKLISDSLKEIDDQNKKKRRATLEQRIAQAGLSWSPAAYYMLCVGMGAGVAGLVFLFNQDMLVVLGGAVVGAVGAPNWILGLLRARRIRKFIDAFPASVDIIIRGVKAGLPVADCFRMIASEAEEPVRSEFKRIVDSSAVGLSISEATDKFAERMPVPEASFFSIVINIQQKAGGNLSETLTNLATVLRDRKKMKGKIKAMSAEAKSSAAIIGSLPFLVGGLVYLTTPAYMMVLFTTTPGKIVIVGGLLWMSIGIFIMRKMINFDI